MAKAPDLPITGKGLVGSGTSPAQSDNPTAIGTKAEPLNVAVVPEGSAPNPVDAILAGPKVDAATQVAPDATGELKDTTITPPEVFQTDGDNTPIAPLPRNQIDENPGEDPMRRQPGEAPSQIADQTPEGGEQLFSMTMPYWDGVQMHERGTILPFKIEEAPYGAKLVEGEPSKEPK